MTLSICAPHAPDTITTTLYLRAEDNRGIRFLAPSDAEASSERLSDEDLLISLAQHPDPRLRFALIPWFILHPQIHSTVPW